MDNLLHSDITGETIKAFYKVYNTLGYGFLEKVYENAMAFELEDNSLFVQTQLPIKVFYIFTMVEKRANTSPIWWLKTRLS